MAARRDESLIHVKFICVINVFMCVFIYEGRQPLLLLRRIAQPAFSLCLTNCNTVQSTGNTLTHFHTINKSTANLSKSSHTKIYTHIASQ